MATCSPSTLLASANCFMCLSEKQLDMVIAQMLRQWVGGSPTPNAILAEAANIVNLDTKQIELIQAQLLCDIAG